MALVTLGVSMTDTAARLLCHSARRAVVLWLLGVVMLTQPKNPRSRNLLGIITQKRGSCAFIAPQFAPQSVTKVQIWVPGIPNHTSGIPVLGINMLGRMCGWHVTVFLNAHIASVCLLIAGGEWC